ncbi:hypothetical protein ACW95P_01870 [Candidatus Mycoplasma pogonae]
MNKKKQKEIVYIKYFMYDAYVFLYEAKNALKENLVSSEYLEHEYYENLDEWMELTETSFEILKELYSFNNIYEFKTWEEFKTALNDEIDSIDFELYVKEDEELLPGHLMWYHSKTGHGIQAYDAKSAIQSIFGDMYQERTKRLASQFTSHIYQDAKDRQKEFKNSDEEELVEAM